MPQLNGGPNNREGWKVPQDEISGGRLEVWDSCATTTRNRKAPINITATKRFLESCHVYLIHYLANSTKVPTFLQVSPRRIENLISEGPLIRAMGLEKFSKTISGGTLIRDVRVLVRGMGEALPLK